MDVKYSAIIKINTLYIGKGSVFSKITDWETGIRGVKALYAYRQPWTDSETATADYPIFQKYVA